MSRSHVFGRDGRVGVVDAIPRESVHLFLPAGPGRPVRWMVYHYGFACAAPRSFSSHLEQVFLFFYPPEPPPYLVTSCASVCVRARVHGPTNLLFFRRSRRIDLTSTENPVRYQTPSDHTRTLQTHSRTGHHVTLSFGIP